MDVNEELTHPYFENENSTKEHAMREQIFIAHLVVSQPTWMNQRIRELSGFIW